MADSFSAEAGIDEEAYRDEVRLDIIVDRKLKESIRFTREAPRRRISVPLAGARQLELSVQYGPDYRAQTLCFADAYFRVRDRAAFQEHLVRCRNRADMARELPPGPLPPLPAWKEVKVEPFVWRERPALRIGNGVLEYEIVPSFGGRLVGFRRPAGRMFSSSPGIRCRWICGADAAITGSTPASPVRNRRGTSCPAKTCICSGRMNSASARRASAS